MFGLLKNLFGRPRQPIRIAATLRYADMGRKGLVADVEVSRDVEGYPWSWSRPSAALPGGSVSEGVVDMSAGWVDQFVAAGFAPGRRNGEPIVVAREGLGAASNATLLNRYPGMALHVLPNEVFSRMGSLGSALQNATLVEPTLTLTVILLEAEEVASAADATEDYVPAHATYDPEPFSLTEEESAAVGRLAAMGYALAVSDEARRDRDDERREEADASPVMPPPTGIWATLPEPAPERRQDEPAPPGREATSGPADAGSWMPSDAGYGR